jgi:hypothetical protein
MTREVRRTELSDMEPPLPELPRLRELSRGESPSKGVEQAVFKRLERTLNTSSKVLRREASLRHWVWGLSIAVAVPSALAATPTGSTLVRRTVTWVEHTVALLDTTSALRERRRTAESPAIEKGAKTGAPIASAGSSAPLLASDEGRSAHPPIAAFQKASTSGPGAMHRDNALMPTAEADQAPAGGSAVVVYDSTRVSDSAPAKQPAPAKVQEKNREPDDSEARQNAATSTLHRERQLLERARVRLGAGDPRGALVFTARHEERFPNGMLTAERRAIISQAQELERRARQIVSEE